MPYKNIKDRRAAWRRWRERNIEKHKERQRIQKIAVYHNPIPQVCEIDVCTSIGERHHPDYSKPKEIIWLCKPCHEFLHSKKYCSEIDCTNKHLARGMCQKHYSYWRRRQ